jgi:DeoR/GlpR family transcriptional regulator of sugar metabolism
MLKRERQAYILEPLNLQNKVPSTDLLQLIIVSAENINQNLRGGVTGRDWHVVLVKKAIIKSSKQTGSFSSALCRTRDYHLINETS